MNPVKGKRRLQSMYLCLLINMIGKCRVTMNLDFKPHVK